MENKNPITQYRNWTSSENQDNQSRKEVVMRKENRWKSLLSMETPRCLFGATAIGEKIYIAGGCNYQRIPLSSVEVYDIKLNKWSRLPNMKNMR